METATSLPPVLEKATEDEWQYLLETVTGQKFFFGSATVHGEFVHLCPADSGIDAQFMDGPTEGAYVIKERGIDVRLSAIAWVAEGYS